MGWYDFGDPSYWTGLRVLLRAYDEEARLNDYGRMAVRHTVLSTLEKRLRAEKAWRDAPEILDIEVRRPIVICGLVRTGSTALPPATIWVAHMRKSPASSVTARATQTST